MASLNINQPTSSESSAAFMDQNNMYPLNDSPMPDYTALLDIVVSTPDFTLKMITLSFHYQPCHLIINHLLHPFWYRKIQLLTEFCSLYKYFIEINRNFKHDRFLAGRKKHLNGFVHVVFVSRELIMRSMRCTD